LDRAGSQGPGCSRPSSEFIQNQRLDTISDSDGKFEIGGAVSPGTYPMKITINKTGYYSLEKEFTFSPVDNSNFTFIILMVRKP